MTYPQVQRLAKLTLSLITASAIAFGITERASAQASSFAVLSSSDVSMKNRVNINSASSGTAANVGGTTVLMGRGNAAAPDTIGGDVIGTTAASAGLDCANNPPGTTAVCLGNDSEISGVCATGGGAVSQPSECTGGADVSGQNAVTTLLPQAVSAASTLSSTLAALPSTQVLSAIVVGTRGNVTISSSGGVNVVSVPSIASSTNSTITLNGSATDTFVINVGSASNPGSLQIGNNASVVLTGGITPDRVIFNLVGSGTAAQLGNHTVFNGTILAPQGQFTSGDGDTPNPVLINGALLFGESISIGNNTNLTFYPFVGVGGGSTSGGGTSSSAS